MNKKAFTLSELIIAIVIIGILSAILIPHLISGSQTSKENIIDIYNEEQKVYCYDIDTGELLGGKEFDSEGFKLIEIKNNGKIINLYFRKEVQNETSGY